MEDEVVLLEVQLDEKRTAERVVEIRKQLDLLRTTAKELKKDFGAGAISSTQFQTAMAKVSDQTRILNKELGQQSHALAESQKGANASAGGWTKLSQGLSQTSVKYRELSDAERANATASAQASEQIQRLTKEYDEHSRKLTTSKKGTTDFLREINIMGVSVGQTEEAFKNGFEATKVFTKGIFTTRGALIALTAVPIIALLVGLIAFFKSTDEGADKLEQGMAGLKAGLDAVAKVLAPLGKLLVDTFTHPIDSLNKLNSAFLHPIDSLKKIVTGSKDMATAAVTNFASAAAAAIAYTTTMQQIEDRENALISQRAKVGLQVDQALLKTKDRNLSERERINILRQAGKAEADLAQKQLAIARDALAARYRLNLDEQRRTKTLSDPSVKASLEAEAAVYNARRENLNIQQTITNRESALREQESASRKEAAEQVKQAAKEAAQARVHDAELALVLAKQKGEDTLKIEEEVIRRRAALESVGLKKNSAERRLIEAQTDAAILALRVDHVQALYDRESAIEQAAISENRAAALAGSVELENLEIREAARQARDRIQKIKSEYETHKINKTQYEAELKDIERNADLEKQNIRNRFAAERINKEVELGKLIIQTELDTSQDYLAIRRNQATAVIALEEKQQLDLLALQDISAKERKTREDAIVAASKVKRKAVFREILADERVDRIAEVEAELADIDISNRKKLKKEKELLALYLEADLANVELTKKQKEALQSKYDNAVKKKNREYYKEIFDGIVQAAQDATATLSAFAQAQSASVLGELDRQQEAALKAAGTNAELREALETKFQKRRIELEHEFAERKKKIESAQNLIAIARGIAEAWKLPPPFNYIQAALVTLNGYAQQRIIDSQSFAEGGVAEWVRRYVSDGKGTYVRGPGSGKSDSIPARISNGESVINANSTRKFYDQLSALNVAGGGRAFPGAMTQPVGGYVPFSAGGVAMPVSSTEINAGHLATMIESGVANALKNMKSPVVAVTDIRRVDADMTRVESSNDF